MSEVVDNSLRYLTGPDIRAIATYLKSVPAFGDGADAAAAPTPSAPRQVSEHPPPQESGPGLHVFEGACMAVTNSTARAPFPTMPHWSAPER